jgi:hypothetical protein
MKVNQIEDHKHDELTMLITPLIDFMNQNKINYFIVAGKDNVCSKYMNGNYYDIHGMITSMVQSQPQIAYMLKEIVEISTESSPLL